MDWYEGDVVQVEKQVLKLSYSPKVLFYGSSSIRLWDSLYEDFKQYQPINLGFGGSTLEACVYFFNRIMQPFSPEMLVVYAGDNDLGDGKEPEDVLFYFTQLQQAIRSRFPEAKIFYLSIKPSIARWDIDGKIRHTNELIKSSVAINYPEVDFVDVYSHMIDEHGQPNPELYAEDGLHMSQEGYEIWKKVILNRLSTIVDDSLTVQQ